MLSQIFNYSYLWPNVGSSKQETATVTQVLCGEMGPFRGPSVGPLVKVKICNNFFISFIRLQQQAMERCAQAVWPANIEVWGHLCENTEQNGTWTWNDDVNSTEQWDCRWLTWAWWWPRRWNPRSWVGRCPSWSCPSPWRPASCSAAGCTPGWSGPAGCQVVSPAGWSAAPASQKTGDWGCSPSERGLRRGGENRVNFSFWAWGGGGGVLIHLHQGGYVFTYGTPPRLKSVLH